MAETTDSYNNKRYLFLVSTPIQYINALEYIHINGILFQNCKLLILSHSKRTVDQIMCLDDIEKWLSVKTPMFGSLPVILKMIRTLFFMKLRSNEIPVVGNCNNIWNIYLLQKYKRSNISNKGIVLDDGTATVLTLYLRSKDDFSVNISQDNLINKILIFITSLELICPDGLIFFTILKGLKGSSRDIVQIHDYSYFKSIYRLKKKIIKNELWFIGAPYVQLGLIEEKVYKDIIFKTRKRANDLGLSFKYIHHRSESSLPSYINKEETIYNEMPIEIYLAKQEEEPAIISSIYSSALFTLPYFSISIKYISYDIRGKFLNNNKNFTRDMDEIYKYIGSSKHISLEKI